MCCACGGARKTHQHALPQHTRRQDGFLLEKLRPQKRTTQQEKEIRLPEVVAFPVANLPCPTSQQRLKASRNAAGVTWRQDSFFFASISMCRERSTTVEPKTVASAFCIDNRTKCKMCASYFFTLVSKSLKEETFVLIHCRFIRRP